MLDVGRLLRPSGIWGGRNVFLWYSLPRKRTFKISGTKLFFQLRAALGIQTLSKGPIPKINSVLEEFKCEMQMKVGLHYGTLYIIHSCKPFSLLYPFSCKLSKIPLLTDSPSCPFTSLVPNLPCLQKGSGSPLPFKTKWHYTRMWKSSERDPRGLGGGTAPEAKSIPGSTRD